VARDAGAVRDEWVELNRAWWDERAPIHVASEFYDLEGFLADPAAVRLRPFEVAEVGDVAGRTLVHPQCHFGLDTLSWARLGATVTGIDFSERAVATAAEAARTAGLAADFVAGNVYDAVELVGGRQFDIVYTGLGAINWLPDIERWARVMADLAAPGGMLYLAEFHPVHSVLGDEDLTVTYPYFHDRDEPLTWDEEGTYAQLDAATEHNRTVEWHHGLGSVVSAVIDAGFTVELLHEFDHTLFPRWPFLVRDGDTYRLPPEMPSIPLMFSLRARKAAARQ
jgi:SAM-dependent methyltransferase